MEILIAVTVYGNLKAEQRIELTETGRVLGDLVTKTLVIDEGASFKGSCTMEVMEEKKASDGAHAEQDIEEESKDSEEKGEDKKGKK